MKKITFKTLLVAAGLLVSGGAWGAVTSLYERGTTNAWADADLDDWTQSDCTATISGGLSVSTTNGGWTCTKDITVTSNAIVTLDAKLKTGGASGRSGSYDYVQIGGVKVGFNEQDKVAFVDIDGVSTNLTLTYNRASSYDIQIVIDQATGAVSYTVGSASGSATSSTAITNVVFGHSRAGRENYSINPVLQKIEVSEEPQTVSTAGYTVKYMCGGSEIKEADTSRSGVIGTFVTLTEGDKASFKNADSTKKYIYDSDDSSSNAIAGDGSTVITVTFREAATWSYTVNAMNGESKLETIATGSDFEAETVKVPFHTYYNVDGTLYCKEAINKEFNYTFTLTSDNQAENLAYTASDFKNVIFFSEAEDIATLTSVTGGGIGIRCSYSSGAYASEDAVITTLTPGKYKITGAGYGGELIFKAGETEILNMPSVGYQRETTSDVFEITVNTDITFIGGTGNNAALDYVFIQQIANASATVGADKWATYVASYALDFSGVSGLTAYTATTDGSTVTLTPVDDVQAGTAVVLKANAADTYSIPVIATSTTAKGDLTSGAVADVTADTEHVYYGLAMIGGKAKFAKITSGAIADGKAYFKLDATSPAREILDIDGETTGIENVKAAAENSVIYNLQGVRVAQPTKGLYIMDGKKMVIK